MNNNFLVKIIVIILTIIFLMAFVAILAIKLLIYLAILLLIILLFKNIYPYKEDFKDLLTVNDKKTVTNFRVIEAFKFVLVWIIYLFIIIRFLPGLRIGIKNIDFIIDTMSLFFHVWSATIFVEDDKVKILRNQINREIKFILPNGFFLSPGVWFLYSISQSVNPITLVQDEEKENPLNNFHFFKDDRLARFRSKEISPLAAAFNNFLILKVSKMNFSVDFSFFRIFISLILALVLNSAIYHFFI